jgi:hypothetical protein
VLVVVLGRRATEDDFFADAAATAPEQIGLDRGDQRGIVLHRSGLPPRATAPNPAKDFVYVEACRTTAPVKGEIRGPRPAADRRDFQGKCVGKFTCVDQSLARVSRRFPAVGVFSHMFRIIHQAPPPRPLCVELFLVE